MKSGERKRSDRTDWKTMLGLNHSIKWLQYYMLHIILPQYVIYSYVLIMLYIIYIYHVKIFVLWV